MSTAQMTEAEQLTSILRYVDQGLSHAWVALEEANLSRVVARGWLSAALKMIEQGGAPQPVAYGGNTDMQSDTGN